MHALWKDLILTFSESQGVSFHELFPIWYPNESNLQ